ncbi:MAG: abortive infection family protein [Patescibacteria group bacterium]
MTLSERTIEAIRLIINGDEQGPNNAARSIYKRGTDIQEFFAEFDISPEPGSRWFMTENCLKQLNGTDKIKKVIEKQLHPMNYIGHEGVILGDNIQYLNQFLEFDGYKIVMAGKFPKVLSVGADVQLDVATLPKSLGDNLQNWIDAHYRKCQQKIADEDYEGAITNARSMVEQLYIWILKNTEGGYDRKLEGNLGKIGNEVSRRFDMDPELYNTPLKQLITGMNSMIAGLSGLRNKASDAHGTEHKPGIRHAKLAVNSAITLVSYFSELCNDKNILDNELKEQDIEALNAYYEAMADSMAYDQWRGK